ncbi:tetratricopeptide repeat protein [Lutibacter sp.]|uniref:tetratricopeptide repeat protein n=1 Tax=Lutibacter sp. TaxID=1925666 RepID=UPI002734533F|nr:tetratricopeptide repeat protein [Lutibacter sp.]MDP3313151.1 tetratricopeptide repeat protein [Lutibacter sp.]
MNFKKVILQVIAILVIHSISAQQSTINTHYLKEYNHAVSLYQSKAYMAAQQQFDILKSQFDYSSELKANCEYYAAYCAIKLEQPNADDLMIQFVEKYPTSTKRNGAFLEVADYYFKIGKYAYATKWYARVSTPNLTFKQEEEFNFNYAYALFATKNYAKAKNYFLPLLDSAEYGAKAKYYYGYIAYNQDDYETADKYLSEVVEDSSFKTDVSYYLADMNFKLGKFDKALEHGLPLLSSAKGLEHSEISKIVGESYFNLKNYTSAITHLKNYKGKRGKWNNTDYYLLGYSYYKQNDFENAVSTFNKIIEGSNHVAQNAYYHLGECYLKLDKKQEALNAFKNASSMNFSPEIQQDAWLNYAKISYDIGNPYKSVPEVLKEFISLYPNSTHKNEINELIISSYITSKDYAGALDYLKNKKTAKEKKLYQMAAFFRGVELFNDGDFSAAKQSFENSISEPTDPKLTARATFWKGESNYRLNNFSASLFDFESFEKLSISSSTPEYENLYYNLGYANYKKLDYSSAIDSFKKFINKNSQDKLKINDAYLRVGDAYFVSRKYNDAITYYTKVIERNGADSDYAHFQKAISYGLTNNETAKIKELNSFIKTFQRSAYKDDALYILGDTYFKKNDHRLALENFDQLITSYPKSTLVSKSMLKKGLIYYNTDKNEQAIATFKSIVSKYPNTAESKQAVKNTRQIYVDLGRVDEYATWVKGINFVNVSDAELDNDTYESAEKQFLQGNHSKAITGFQKYLQSFPNGIHKLKAHFYAAQSLFSQNNLAEAILHYTSVVKEESNEFSEISLSQLALIYLKNNDWKNAIPILERLEKESNSSQNTTFAQSNLMKGYYEAKNYDQAVNYAEIVLQNAKLETRIKSDAHLIIARSAIKTSNLSKARAAYKEVEKIASGEVKAESLYYKAFFENSNGNYEVSNQIVQQIAADFGAYKYWAAKGLVVMAKNHHQLKDAFQATYILESVITNFSQFSEVVEEAKTELKAIKTEQAKTNESIKN